MSDACLVAGFVLALVGVYLIAGPGWACLIGGVVLFIAGGVSGRKP
jgi:hypothetical protein